MSVEMVVGLALVALLAIGIPTVVLGYRRRWTWTGLPERRIKRAREAEVEPPKTLWDWLQLLLIPVALALVGVLLNEWQDVRDQIRTQELGRADRELALDQQREAAFQRYLDDMTSLMLEGDLLSERSSYADTVVAQTRTLTTLSRLDGPRKGELVRFLVAAGLISRPEFTDEPDPIVSLKDADLSGADLSFTQLWSVALGGANLRDADLTGADLDRSNLAETDLRGACLTQANLDETFMYKTSFADAYVGWARFDLSKAEEVDFSGAYLGGARGVGLEWVEPVGIRAWVRADTVLEGVDIAGAMSAPEDPDGIFQNWPEWCVGTAKSPRRVCVEWQPTTRNNEGRICTEGGRRVPPGPP